MTAAAGRQVVDSSAWLEYLADGPNASYFATAIEAPEHLVVPSITLLEVFKVILRQRSENEALQAVALMQQGEVGPDAVRSSAALEYARAFE